MAKFLIVLSRCLLRLTDSNINVIFDVSGGFNESKNNNGFRDYIDINILFL